MRRPHPHRHDVFAFALLVLGTAAQAQEAATCRTDGATGLPIPTRAAGVCVGTLDGESVLVQRNRQGLFIAGIGSEAFAADPAGGRRVEVHGPSASILYCPVGLLDFARGTPGADCLGAGPALRPGPGALVGAGSVRASVRVDDAGRTGCPVSSRVVASLVSVDGERFEVTGSLRMSGDACAGAYDRVELEYRSETVESGDDPATRAMTPERARRLDRVMELDEDQWQAIEIMLALTPGDWELLQALVEAEEAATKPAAQAPPSAGAIDLGAAAGAEPNPEAKVQSIATILNTIVSRLNAVRSNVEGLVGRIPDRPDVRSLVGQVDLGQLRSLMEQARDVLQGLVDVARELRAGYDDFDAAAFRQRLGVVLDDVGRLSTLYQRLLCLDNPDLVPRGFSGTLLRRLIDRVPGVVLYGLSTVLETARDDWDTLIAGIVDAVPAELTELCSDGVASRALSVDFESAVCSALRPKATDITLKVVQTHVAIALLVFRIAKNRAPDELKITLGATVVGGATGGTAVKNPAYEAAESWVERLENVKDVLEKVVDRRKDCVDADADIEGELRDCAKDGCACAVPLSVLFGGRVSPSYTYVARLVETRIGQAEEVGYGDVVTARDRFELAIEDVAAGTPAGYGLLCQAYGSLLVPTDAPAVAPVAPGPSSPSRRPVPRADRSRRDLP